MQRMHMNSNCKKRDKNMKTHQNKKSDKYIYENQ
jgi:hypothetical protein